MFNLSLFTLPKNENCHCFQTHKTFVLHLTDYIIENTEHLKVLWISHVHIISQRRFSAAVSVSDLLVVHIYDGHLSLICCGSNHNSHTSPL